MSRDLLSIKGFAVAVILLFIGIAILPTIHMNVVSASMYTTPVEVTTEACGIKGYDIRTVSLTNQQYQKLEQYLNDLRERVNKTTTREETVVIFNDAVVELNKYGLLPKGMSVEQAQRVVSGCYHSSILFHKIQNDFQRITKNVQRQYLSTNTKNAFCLLFATLSKIPGYSPDPFIIPFGALLVLGLGPVLLLSVIGAEELAKQLIDFELFLWTLNPFRLFNFVLFMGYNVALRSIGLKGLVSENFESGGLLTGYSGLMLNPFSDKTYFLGFALRIDALE
jgi:hypothetical protein